MQNSDVAGTKFCVRSPARKNFLFVTPHCTASQNCYQKFTPHHAAPQIIHLSSIVEKIIVVVGLWKPVIPSYRNLNFNKYYKAIRRVGKPAV